jgi:hypothetical protein
MKVQEETLIKDDLQGPKYQEMNDYVQEVIHYLEKIQD